MPENDGKKWTAEHNKMLLDMKAARRPDEEIAAALGRKVTAMNAQYKKINVGDAPSGAAPAAAEPQEQPKLKIYKVSCGSVVELKRE